MTKYFYCLEDAEGNRTFHSTHANCIEMAADECFSIAWQKYLISYGPCVSQELLEEEIFCTNNDC